MTCLISWLNSSHHIREHLAKKRKGGNALLKLEPDFFSVKHVILKRNKKLRYSQRQPFRPDTIFWHFFWKILSNSRRSSPEKEKKGRNRKKRNKLYNSIHVTGDFRCSVTHILRYLLRFIPLCYLAWTIYHYTWLIVIVIMMSIIIIIMVATMTITILSTLS